MINPLEASMAAESVFIYPNGREMPKDPNARLGQLAAAGDRGAMPFQGLGGPSAAASGGGGGGAMPSGGLFSPLRSGGGGGGAAGRGAWEGDGELTGEAQWLAPGVAPPTPPPPPASLLPVAPSNLDALPPRPRPAASAAAAAAGAGPGAAGQGRAALTPVDVETVLRQNQDKLNMLQVRACVHAAAVALRVQRSSGCPVLQLR